MISCPTCEKELNLYKRTDKYGYLNGFFVECVSCGFNKYLRRVITNHRLWKIGHIQGYREAEKNDTLYVYASIAIAFVLGLFTAVIINFSDVFKVIG